MENIMLMDKNRALQKLAKKHQQTTGVDPANTVLV
jgi:hypothetical protein